MTTLIDKASRDALGVDTLSRGIAYACHLLKSVIPVGVIDFNTAMTVVDNKVTGKLSIKATLDYDPVAHYSAGSDYLVGILSLSNSDPIETFSPMGAAISGVTIPEDDTRVTILEEYLAWLILLYQENKYNDKDVNAVKISQGLTPQRFYKTFSLILDYDPLVYSATGNIIEAIDGEIPTSQTITTFGNEGSIGNLFIVGNVN